MAKSDKSHAAELRPPPESGGMSTGVAIIGFFLCFLAGAAVMWGYDSHRLKTAGGITAEGGAWSDADSPIPVTAQDPMWGKRDAPVTIVTFSDFQCPFCSRVEATLEQVKSTYGPDKVRIIWKDQPLSFHDKAKPASEAAQAVFLAKGSDAFWKFHSTAFKNQQQLSPDNYEKWAQAAGVEPAEFKQILASKKPAKKVEENMQVANKVGATGTPAFRINGAELSGAQPFEKFKELIDKELSKAQAKIAAGTPKDKIYVEMSKENFKAAPKKEQDDDEEKEDDTTVWKVPVGNSPVKGKADAPVTIALFSDFQCPYCKRVGPTLDKVQETYGDKVRIVWKHEPLPFHPRAEPASQLALEARAQKGTDKAFWDAHDKLFEIQPKLEDADLEKAAADLGLDVAKAKAAIQNHKFKKDIDADMALADDVQASGTPHFFINGRRLVGAQPFEKFQKVIDEELKKFEDSKIPAKDYYASLMKDAKGAPEPEKKKAPAVAPGSPWKGGANAKVVIQQWSDFQCPFCTRVEGTVSEIHKNYGDKVKVVWRDKPLPMHPDAPLAAEAAREAMKQKGPAGFWKMHEKLFANQQKMKREDLESYAQDIGLDMEKFKAALDNRTHKAAVEADDKAGTDIGISGTPAFLINDYYVSGAQPYQKFKKLIDRALAEAK
jgi:protein-disulfide isomerase